MGVRDSRLAPSTCSPSIWPVWVSAVLQAPPLGDKVTACLEGHLQGPVGLSIQGTHLSAEHMSAKHSQEDAAPSQCGGQPWPWAPDKGYGLACITRARTLQPLCQA